MPAFLEKDHLVLHDVSDLRRLEPSVFRVVHDFEIRRFDTGEHGIHVSFASAAGGDLARFPWWDHADADIREMSDADIPMGTVARPFEEMEHGWRLLIWERRGQVFVMQGGGDPQRYTTWFAVSKEAYVTAWRNTIAEVRSAGGAFKHLASALKQPLAVRALQLGNQRLVNLPLEIGTLENLTYLNAYLNQLRSLPETIGMLKRLRWLDLRFNKIDILPETLAMLHCLESINLAENRLREIPNWIMHMPKLSVFWLSGNPVDPESIARIKNARPNLELGTHPR
ncbi:MAG: leucine-rich repeat domain-containing protein [Polyangiaceae bacterium]|nr:leucine-rich repeat domain-containing protein [Polyangiaceae bacterium]